MSEQPPSPHQGAPEHLETEDEQQDIDPAITERLFARLTSEQNLLGGAFAGLAAAFVGAGIWTVVTAVTEYQIGWMAVGVGCLVGYSVRVVGKGVSKPFGVIGAAMSLLGCLLGNLLTVCYFVAAAQQMGFVEILLKLDPVIIGQLLGVTFDPMDLLFYGIAIYEGYRFSFRQISEEDLIQATEGGETTAIETA